MSRERHHRAMPHATTRTAARLFAAAAAVTLAGCAASEPFESARPGPSAFDGRPAAAGAPPAQADPTPSFVLAAPATPGPNTFGEFGGEGERPYAPVAGRAGYQQHTYVDEGHDADVAVSPDGRTIVFSSTRHSERSDLYAQSTSGLAVTKLTTDPADDAFPVFSPDGRRIAFASNRAGNWNIFIMDRDGRNVTAVTHGAAHDLHPSFSPCGNRLVFCRIGGRSEQWELWTADLSTGEKTMIGFGLFPDWSPRRDRDVIAFQRARQRGGRWFSLWTLELNGSEPTNVTEVAMSTNAALVAPAWSPDGSRIAFATVVEPGSGLPGDDGTGRQDIWTINADGTDRHRITDGKGVYATPAWSGDGRLYFVSDRGGKEAIWSARADAPNLSRAAVKPPAATPPFQPQHAQTSGRPID